MQGFVTTASGATAVCGGEDRIFNEAGIVDALCGLDRPDRDGIYRGITEEDRWNAYCTDYEDITETYEHVEGAYVVIHSERRLDQERVEALGYNPTGEYGSFRVTCYHPVQNGEGGEFLYTITDPISIDDLLAEVRARIDIGRPVIESNPSFDERFAVVRIPTWLWVDPDYWYEEHYEPETRGFVTVEVFADPVQLYWEFDEGNWFADCQDEPGTPWTPGATDTDCSVTFTRSSAGRPGDAFEGSARVDWQFRWTLNGADQGPFDEILPVTTDLEIQVGEIQSIDRG